MEIFGGIISKAVSTATNVAGAGVSIVGAGAAGVLTGAAGGYGVVTGDYRHAKNLARCTDELAGNAATYAGNAAMDGGNMVAPAVFYDRSGSLGGWTYACAVVSAQCYKNSNSAKEFKDRDGDLWVKTTECPGVNESQFAIYKNGKNNIIIGCRGTADFNDIGPDAEIVLATVPVDRTLQAVQVATWFKLRYGTVYITGHSLGGCIATYAGMNVGLKVHAFNPGAGPQDAVTKVISDMTSSGSVVCHRISGDPVSCLVGRSLHVQVKTYQANRMNPHSMSNFAEV